MTEIELMVLWMGLAGGGLVGIALGWWLHRDWTADSTRYLDSWGMRQSEARYAAEADADRLRAVLEPRRVREQLAHERLMQQIRANEARADREQQMGKIAEE